MSRTIRFTPGSDPAQVQRDRRAADKVRRERIHRQEATR